MRAVCHFERTTYGDFPALRLSNGVIDMMLLPDVGGKIVSIHHLPSAREWLATNPYLPLRPPRYDASFVETYDSGGLDECFPAVTAGMHPAAPWRGIAIPDHGELWSQPWTVEGVESSSARVALKMACYGVRFPYRFERTLTLSADAPTIKFDYQVTNLTTADMPFIWSIHPILRIETGMHLTLPHGVTTVRVGYATSDIFGETGTDLPWPVVTENIDLSRVPAAEFGQAVKLHTPPLTGAQPVETSLRTADGRHGFTFRFHPDEITHVGLWLNYGGWSGCGSAPYFNLGLEPCIGGADDLETAHRRNEFALLEAKQTRCWSMEAIVN
jgi:hypothetical protein